MNAAKDAKTKNPGELRAEIEALSFMSLALAGTDQQSFVKDHFNKLLKGNFKQESEATVFAINVATVFDRIRQAVRADFQSRAVGAGKPSINPSLLFASFKLNNEAGNGVVTLR